MEDAVVRLLHERQRTLATADWRLVGLAAMSAVIAMVINVKRWQVMLDGQRGEAPLPTLIRLYLIAMFFNNILPSRFAGAVVGTIAWVYRRNVVPS